MTGCAALVGGGQPKQVTTWLVDPQVEIPAEATSVHGITTEMAREQGVEPAEALPEMLVWLQEVTKAGIPLVVFNAPYDLTLLDQELRRHDLGDVWALTDYLHSLRVFDPLCVDRAVDRYRRGKRNLEAACGHYGVVLDNAHDSTEDALAAGRLAYRMGQYGGYGQDVLIELYADRRFPAEMARAWQAFGRMTLDELHAAQVRWYAEQAESFTQYLRRCANEARYRADTADGEQREIALQEAAGLDARVDTVSAEWPMRRPQ